MTNFKFSDLKGNNKLYHLISRLPKYRLYVVILYSEQYNLIKDYEMKGILITNVTQPLITNYLDDVHHSIDNNLKDNASINIRTEKFYTHKMFLYVQKL